MLPVSNVANSTLATFIVGVFFSTCAVAEPGYTNHAGNVVSGWPVKLTATQVVLAEAALKSYLDKQVKEGVITPSERKALGR